MATRVPLPPSKHAASSFPAGLLQLTWLVLLLGLVASASVRAQDPRDAMVARAFNEFDAARRLQLLMSALNPTAGPPRGAWPVGVQLLAQTLIEDGQDSVAGVWLRWAVRLSPDLQPDTVQFLPKVVVAYRSARDFVLGTRAPGDSTAATPWLGPAQETGERVGGGLRQHASHPGGAVGRDDGARVPAAVGPSPRGAQGAAAGGEAHAGTGRRAAKEEGIPGSVGGGGGRGRGGLGGDPRRPQALLRAAAIGQHHDHLSL